MVFPLRSILLTLYPCRFLLMAGASFGPWAVYVKFLSLFEISLNFISIGFFTVEKFFQPLDALCQNVFR